MSDRVVLKLTKHYKNLMAGETAGFEPDEAAHIIKAGGGERIGNQKPAEPAAPKK